MNAALIADLIVIAVVLVSGILALTRGFVQEVLSVAAWIAAAFAALWAFPILRPWARETITISPVLADIVAGGGVFVVTLVLFSLLSGSLAGPIKRSAFSPLDRSLGFLFGVLRGAVLISLAYLALSAILKPGDRPEWMSTARTAPLAAEGADLLRQLAPKTLNFATQESSQLLEQQRRTLETAQKIQSAERSLRGLTSPPTADDTPSVTGGYPNRDRQQLDRLIQKTQ